MNTEKPLLFSDSMVRAILTGRKTQTRRIMNPQPEPLVIIGRKGVAIREQKRPDRIWVREAWQTLSSSQIVFRATEKQDAKREGRPEYKGPWRPSIHLPKDTARIWLTVRDMRMEILQDIKSDDARAEGLACLSKDHGMTWKCGIPDSDGLPGTDDDGWPWQDWNQDPVPAFKKLWDAINASRGFAWDDFPWWVRVYEFEAMNN